MNDDAVSMPVDFPERKPKRRSSGRLVSGMTLIELLVIVAIVLILAVLSVQGMRSVMGRVHQVTCQSNLRHLTLGLMNYTADNNGEFLASFNGASAWMNPLRSYMNLDNNAYGKLVHCPGNEATSVWFKQPNGSMGMNYGLIHSPFGTGTVRPSSSSFHVRRVVRPRLMAMMADNCSLALTGPSKLPEAYGMSASHVRNAQLEAQASPSRAREIFPHNGVMHISFFDGSVQRVPWQEVQPDWWSRLPQENPNWQPAPPIQ